MRDLKTIIKKMKQQTERANDGITTSMYVIADRFLGLIKTSLFKGGFPESEKYEKMQ